MQDQQFHKIKEVIISSFEKQGFITNPNPTINGLETFIINFIRTNDYREDTVIVDFQPDSQKENVAINFFARAKLNKVEAIIPANLRVKVRDIRTDLQTIKLFGSFFEDQRLHDTKSLSDNFEDFSSRLTAFISDKVLPGLEQFKTLKELHQTVNESVDSFSPLIGQTYLFNKIIIAGLANSSDFNELYDAIMQRHLQWLETAENSRDKEYYQNCVDLLLFLHQNLSNQEFIGPFI